MFRKRHAGELIFSLHGRLFGIMFYKLLFKIIDPNGWCICLSGRFLRDLGGTGIPAGRRRTGWPGARRWRRAGSPKCRRDHRLKQDPRWTVSQLPDGTFRWTIPTGRQYTTEPTRYPV
jgi:hypothetical protein